MDDTCAGCCECLDEVDGVLLADGFEAALIGFGTHFTNAVAVYDRGKCIEILMEDGASYEDAVEHFDFNVTGAWVGPNTPVFVTKKCERSDS